MGQLEPFYSSNEKGSTSCCHWGHPQNKVCQEGSRVVWYLNQTHFTWNKVDANFFCLSLRQWGGNWCFPIQRDLMKQKICKLEGKKSFSFFLAPFQLWQCCMKAQQQFWQWELLPLVLGCSEHPFFLLNLSAAQASQRLLIFFLPHSLLSQVLPRQMI